MMMILTGGTHWYYRVHLPRAPYLQLQSNLVRASGECAKEHSDARDLQPVKRVSTLFEYGVLDYIPHSYCSGAPQNAGVTSYLLLGIA